jgi:hypothetical protein
MLELKRDRVKTDKCFIERHGWLIQQKGGFVYIANFFKKPKDTKSQPVGICEWTKKISK